MLWSAVFLAPKPWQFIHTSTVLLLIKFPFLHFNSIWCRQFNLLTLFIVKVVSRQNSAFINPHKRGFTPNSIKTFQWYIFSWLSLQFSLFQIKANKLASAIDKIMLNVRRTAFAIQLWPCLEVFN